LKWCVLLSSKSIHLLRRRRRRKREIRKPAVTYEVGIDEGTHPAPFAVLSDCDDEHPSAALHHFAVAKHPRVLCVLLDQFTCM
jgi:hypothetical protein